MSDLPKQWKHWLASNGFRWSKRYGGRSTGAYYPTRDGRSFRVTCCLDAETRTPLLEGKVGIRMFQIDDGNFDRWANSVGAEVPLPTTLAEFKQAVQTLLANSAAKAA